MSETASQHTELEEKDEDGGQSQKSEEPEKRDEVAEKAPEKRNLLQMMRKKIFPTKIRVPEAFSFTKEARKPITRFMNSTGLHDGQNGRFSNWRRRAILVYLFVCCIRRASQLGPDGMITQHVPRTMSEALFDPNVIFSATRFLFAISGLLTAVSMSRLYRKRKEFLQAVDIAIDVDEPTVTLDEAQTASRRLIGFTIGLCIAGGVSEALGKMHQLYIKGAPWMSPLIQATCYFLPFEVLMTLLCECAIVLSAIDFYSSCTFLRYIVASVCRRMKHNFGEAPPLVKLQYLDEIQTQHYHLVIAKKKLEECYSFIIFCYYFFLIPCICFLAYVIYRNAKTWPGLVYGLGTWIVVNVLILLIISIPAFQLTEEGENIATCAFDLHQTCLKGEDDPRISSQMLLLISQIQNNKITVSAHNYFPMHRGILLTMFSAIFTYFLILVQFGGDEEATAVQATPTLRELCRNITF